MDIDREFLKDTLNRLTRRYEAADEARRVALREMVKAQAAIRAIYALATDEPLEFSGTLADACRQVYRTSTKPMTPVEARNAIVALGYNLTQHKNPLASIHSVLKRLAKSGNLKHVTESVTDDDGTAIEKAAYQWRRRAVPKRRRAASAVDTPVVDGIGGIDLPGIDLPGIDFSGIELPKIDFPEIDFGINSLFEQVKPIAPHLGKLKK